MTPTYRRASSWTAGIIPLYAPLSSTMATDWNFFKFMLMRQAPPVKETPVLVIHKWFLKLYEY